MNTISDSALVRDFIKLDTSKLDGDSYTFLVEKSSGRGVVAKELDDSILIMAEILFSKMRQKFSIRKSSESLNDLFLEILWRKMKESSNLIAIKGFSESLTVQLPEIFRPSVSRDDHIKFLIQRDLAFQLSESLKNYDEVMKKPKAIRYLNSSFQNSDYNCLAA